MRAQRPSLNKPLTRQPAMPLPQAMSQEPWAKDAELQTQGYNPAL